MVSIVSGLAAVGLAIGIPLAFLMIPYQFCKGQLSFWSYAALPLGSTIPWLIGLFVVASLSPLVPQVKQAGFGFTPFVLLFGSALLFLVTSIVGAFHGVSPSSFLARLLLGGKISLFFAVAATLWILYLGFIE